MDFWFGVGCSGCFFFLFEVYINVYKISYLFSHSVNAIPVYLCGCGITGTEAEMHAFSLTKKQAQCCLCLPVLCHIYLYNQT